VRPGAHRLLIRDLAQVASPAAGPATLRGADLADVHIVEDAFVLIREDSIESVGRMRDLKPLAGEVEEVDGRGLSAIPGLVDCHTHPVWGGDRVEEFSLRAAGAGYEELHAAGGGILSTVRATRALNEVSLRARVERHAEWMLRHGTTTWEGKSGYGLDRETELASLRAVRAAGGSPTWLGAHAVPPEFDGADAYLDFALAEVLPDAAGLADAADVFLERGAFDAIQARRYLVACREAGLALRLHGDQFTESGAIALAVELGARSVDHLEATGADGTRMLAASDVTGVLLPASALFLDRPMPPARGACRRGRRDCARDRLQPGQFLHDEPAARLLARLHTVEALSGRGAVGRDGQRGARRLVAVPTAGESPRGFAPTSCSSTHPTGVTSPTTWPAHVVAAVIAGGRVAHRR